MECTDCKATNPEGNRFCGQCGAKLGQSSEETVGKKGVRDRHVTEMELTEAVAGRLMKWAGWLGKIAAVIVILFGVLLGKSYFDVREAVQKGKAEIAFVILEGTKEVELVKKGVKEVGDKTAELDSDIAQYRKVTGEATKEVGVVRKAVKEVGDKTAELDSDIAQYRKVNNAIKNLEKEFKDVQGQMVDLGQRGLKAGFFVSTASGPSYFGLRRLECPATAEGNAVAYCAEGSPPSLLQRTSTGELRPVSSFSSTGFQDVSTGPKPTCTQAIRGTIYVEKGSGKVADKPFLCARQSGGTYDWIQLAIIH